MKSSRNIRTILVQTEVLPGRPRENTALILEHIAAAEREKADLVVFPELAVPGYLLGDEWERESFLAECESCSDEIRKASGRAAVIFGNVGLDRAKRNRDGRVRKYDALFTVQDGKFVGPERGPYEFVVKSLLPNYREFDDSRHFHDLVSLAAEHGLNPADLIRPVRTRDFSIGCAICEDAWSDHYPFAPLALLSEQKADMQVVISASPFTVDKNHKRTRLFRRQSGLGCPLLYVNNVGIQNNGKNVFVFDGCSRIYDNHGNAVSAETPFKPDRIVFDLPPDGRPFGQPVEPRADGIAQIHAAIEYGTARFMDLCGVQKAVVGISGGIDSAVVAALYRRLLAPENLLLVNMPGQFTSAKTRMLADSLAGNLGCGYITVPIEESVDLTVSRIDGAIAQSRDGRIRHELRVDSGVLENIQARDRSARVLAAVAASFGAVFTCNANKSELTVGYTTMYGDMSGYLANIADLWKMEVYELARYLNSDVFGSETIPGECMTLKPSAELSPEQDIERGKGDPLIYPYHDRLFACWVESWDRTTPEDILDWYIEGELEKRIGYESKISDIFPTPASFAADLERWWEQYQGLAVAKRIQAPPILTVKRRAFGYDHRESQLGPRYTARYIEMRRRLLASGSANGPYPG